MSKTRTVFNQRRSRVRRKIKKVARGRYRLSVFRSERNIYAQVIDDDKGVTVVSASTLDQELKDQVSGRGGNRDVAAKVGKLVAERAVNAGVKDVIFDRGGYLFHGRVKSLADAAREAGLNF